MARGEGESLVDPAFAAANFYPPASPFFQLPLDENANKISKITKRFVFGSSKLEELRVKAATADVVAKPTRVESVTALLWKAFVASSSTNTSDTKILIQPANLRPKIPSFLPENLIGNVMFSSAVLSVSRGENVKIEEAIKDLRKKKEDLGVVIKDEDGSTSLKIGAKLANLMLGKFAMLSYETHQPYTVSSWCKLPLYEASFGWGSPVWVVGNVAPMLDNVTMLMDSKDGQGIEALVTLPEENMMCFEQNTELLAYASMNPSVLVE
ncbi:BAHD acyltransferase BIA1 [Capsella rubella]|uniref:BAHD acyltransferase BIA1 n=1 Tax=Capsella rubella TaxID=81985 RepID=UPI000CD56BBA|nr:BAHD acyltransferase BIA1 [Capsella rubella]